MFDNHGYKNIVTYPTGVTLIKPQLFKIQRVEVFLLLHLHHRCTTKGGSQKVKNLSSLRCPFQRLLLV